MKIVTKKIHFSTKKEGEILDLTPQIESELTSLKMSEGNVLVFCIGSTCAISTMEYEPGLIKDLPEAIQKIAPDEIDYHHHQTWHDHNGRSHIKASLMGPSITIPFSSKKLFLGTWQQVIFIEWDIKPRKREVVLQFMGE